MTLIYIVVMMGSGPEILGPDCQRYFYGNILNQLKYDEVSLLFGKEEVVVNIVCD